MEKWSTGLVVDFWNCLIFEIVTLLRFRGKIFFERFVREYFRERQISTNTNTWLCSTCKVRNTIPVNSVLNFLRNLNLFFSRNLNLFFEGELELIFWKRIWTYFLEEIWTLFFERELELIFGETWNYFWEIWTYLLKKNLVLTQYDSVKCHNYEFFSSFFRKL